MFALPLAPELKSGVSECEAWPERHARAQHPTMNDNRRASWRNILANCDMQRTPPCAGLMGAGKLEIDVGVGLGPGRSVAGGGGAGREPPPPDNVQKGGRLERRRDLRAQSCTNFGGTGGVGKAAGPARGPDNLPQVSAPREISSNSGPWAPHMRERERDRNAKPRAGLRAAPG